MKIKMLLSFALTLAEISLHLLDEDQVLLVDDDFA
jgi:hypothetical protein